MKLLGRLLLLLAFVLPNAAEARTYYIWACGSGASTGCSAALPAGASDSNNTTQAQSITTPWLSFAPLSASVFNAMEAGSTVCVINGGAVTSTGQGSDYQNLNASRANPITVKSCLDPGGYLANTDSGTSTATGNLTLTDGGKSWGTNAWAGYSVRVQLSDGQIDDVEILSNTATVLTLAPFMTGEARAWIRRTQDVPQAVSYTLQAKRAVVNNTTVSSQTFQLNDAGSWNHDEGYVFQDLDLRSGAHDTGTATGATAGPPGTITDSGKTWTTDQWAGWTVFVLTGTGLNSTCTVASNTGTAITCTGAWSSTAPISGSKYYVYRGTLYGFNNGNEVHYVTIDNVKFDGFNLAVNCSGSAFNGAGAGGTDGVSRHFIIRRSQFVSTHQAIGGGCMDLLLEANMFARNARQWLLDHTVYNFSASIVTTVTTTPTSTQMIGRHNYLIDNSVGVPGTCQGVVWVTHGEKAGYTIDDNKIIETVAATDGNCRGIEITSGYVTPEGFDFPTVRRNRISGVYNVGIAISNAHDAVVESNEIYMDTGISGVLVTPQFSGTAIANNAANYQLSNITIRNNTVRITNPTPSASTYAYGIRKNAADLTAVAPHKFTNNMAHLGSTGNSSTQCFNRTNMADAEFSAWDGNLCYGDGYTPAWTEAYATKAAHNAATGFDANSLTTQPTYAGTPSLTAPALTPDVASPVNAAGVSSSKARIAIDGCLQTAPPSIGAAPYRASACTRAPSAPTGIR